MKLMNVKNVEGLFKVMGRVELVTGEGDRLNLKSKLSQYVSLTKIFSDATIPEMELVAYEPEDSEKLIAFMTSGDT